MMAERGSLFDDDGADLDLDGFAPKAPTVPKAQKAESASKSKKTPSQTKAAIKQAAKKDGWTPRTRRSRRRRTHRTEQLNLKVTAEILEEYYRIADEQNWVLGELLEYALPALVEKLAADNKKTQT